MNDETFKEQIKEDIKFFQNEYLQNNPHLSSDDYAFNYWVLTKLFNIDEELVYSNITEYSDDGCDCFVFFEETEELYIIQNKYYSDENKLSENYVLREFLGRTIDILNEEKYRRSEELQRIFTKYKNDPEFKIYMNLYITNNLITESMRNIFERFTRTDLKCYIGANIYSLNDIKNIYYNERKEETKTFQCTFKTINQSTVLNINSESYKLPSLTDAKYILTPVKLIYDIVKDAKNKGYMLFEENIREYLGNKGANVKIAKTLESDTDRDNFFYYNNGITVICDRVERTQLAHESKYNTGYITYNPQIVNGCQTVNTIYETLNKYSEIELDDKFKNTFVMVKLLVLDKESENNKVLYQDIVKYNNSQNAITEKNFAANKQLFINLQKELKKYGLLLAVKQSDPYKFRQNENFNDYRPIVEKYSQLYGVEFSKLEDIIVQLEKFLQVILAFFKDGYNAFTKKSQLLKVDAPTYNDVIACIRDGALTNNDLVNLYLIFLKSEKDKKNSEDKRTPIPYYLLGFIGNDLKGLSSDEFRKYFRYIYQDKSNLDVIYKFYKRLTMRYKSNYKNTRGIEYNQMIKSQIDTSILERTINDELEMIESNDERITIKNFRDHLL